MGMGGCSLEILALVDITGTDDETFESFNVIGLFRDEIPSEFTDNGIIRQYLNGNNDSRKCRAATKLRLDSRCAHSSRKESSRWVFLINRSSTGNLAAEMVINFSLQRRFSFQLEYFH